MKAFTFIASTVIVLTAALQLTSATARAQSECSALLQHGIYDYIRESNISANASQMSSEICQAYQNTNKMCRVDQPVVQPGMIFSVVTYR
jgi:hypothetical protein